MFNYSIRLEYDKPTDSYMIECRDLPFMHGVSLGDEVENAVFEAVDALTLALSVIIDERRPIPAATPPQEGEQVVILPVLVAMKCALHNAMLQTGTRKADLGRILGIKSSQIERLLDVCHSSKVESVERALRYLNKGVSVDFYQIAA